MKTEECGDQGEVPLVAKGSATRLAGHRVKFHREDLLNKFSLHRHSRKTADGEEEMLAKTPASLTESLSSHEPPLATPDVGGGTEERARWFKKIFKHRRPPARGEDEEEDDDEGEVDDAGAASSLSVSNASFLSAVDGSAGDFTRDDDSLEDSAASFESSSVGSRTAKICNSSLSVELMNRQESSSPPRTMRRFKSKFRLRKSSNGDGSSVSSCMSESTPEAGNFSGKITRASSTGTLASNCGAMSRRSYRIKLDHALQKAHLRRRNYGLSDAASEYSALSVAESATDVSDRSGFMMAPDFNDEVKTHSAELYQSVVVQAQMPS